MSLRGAHYSVREPALAPTRSRPLSRSGSCHRACRQRPLGVTQLRAPSSCEVPTEQGTREALLELGGGGRVSSISPTQAEDAVTEQHRDFINRAPEGEADSAPCPELSRKQPRSKACSLPPSRTLEAGGLRTAHLGEGQGAAVTAGWRDEGQVCTAAAAPGPQEPGPCLLPGSVTASESSEPDRKAEPGRGSPRC